MLSIVTEPTEPTFSARLSRPFLRVMHRRGLIPDELMEGYERVDLDDRVPARQALDGLVQMQKASNDPDLGLHAALAYEVGDYDVAEYCAAASPTVRGALEAICRYSRLLSDVARHSFEVDGDRARLCFDSDIPLPRASIDYTTGMVFTSSKNWLAGTEIIHERVIWFQYDEPADTSTHRLVFEDTPIVFGAPRNAIQFRASDLELPIPSANPKLHRILQAHAEAALGERPSDQSTTRRVRELIVETLPCGTTSIEEIASQLEVSRRTLLRRLAAEDTTFKDLLDDTRRGLAMEYLSDGALGASEVALLLGYSQPTAFHRAFKRWTGLTPEGYRRGERR